MRLFIAVNLPDALRQELWAAAAALRRGDFPVKWVAADALHLTLKFLGEVAPEREPELLAGMARAAGGAAVSCRQRYARPSVTSRNGSGPHPGSRGDRRSPR